MSETLVITEQPKYKLTVVDGKTLTLAYTAANVTIGSTNIPDGDKGDITVTNAGATWTIDNGAVDTAKLGGDITAAGKALLDDADAAAQRTTLGLGSIATQAASNVAITGGSITGLSNLTTTNATVSGLLNADHIHGNLAGSVYAHVRAAENLAKGDPVYISGSHGSGSTLIAEVSKADAADPAKMPAVGVMDAALSQNATGHMVITGNITTFDTDAYDINDTLYVAAGGGLTNTPPTTGNLIQPVGQVERKNQNNGAFVVKVNGVRAYGSEPDTIVQRDSGGNITQNAVYISGTYYGNTVAISAGDTYEADVFQLPGLENNGGVGPNANGTFLVRHNSTNEVLGNGNIGDPLTLRNQLEVSSLAILPDPASGGSNKVLIEQYNTSRTIDAADIVEASSVFGTDGLLYATGTATCATNATHLKYDAANKYLLVNTTGSTVSPSQALHVNGGNAYVSNTGGSASVIVNRTDGAAFSVNGAANGALRLEEQKALLLQTQPKADVVAGNASNLTTCLTYQPSGTPPIFALLTTNIPTSIALDTTTGTKIGTATGQKIGFWNATPVVQPTTSVAEATFVENSGGTAVNVDSTFDGYTLQQVVRALRNIGLLA